MLRSLGAGGDAVVGWAEVMAVIPSLRWALVLGVFELEAAYAQPASRVQSHMNPFVLNRPSALETPVCFPALGIPHDTTVYTCSTIPIISRPSTFS